MIAVIFEFEPNQSGREEYLDAAAALRAQLETADGFLSIERFESLSQPGRILSLSFWRDEAAIAAWRNGDAHRQAQAGGRAAWFNAYRIRVAQVVRDYGMAERTEAPADSRLFHG